MDIAEKIWKLDSRDRMGLLLVQIAKAISKYSELPGLDLVNFYEQVVFCFLTGIADMHLKNFSLITRPGPGSVLSPAYDMLCTAIVNPADDEELAITLNGKKIKIKKGDFAQHLMPQVWTVSNRKTSFSRW